MGAPATHCKLDWVALTVGQCENSTLFSYLMTANVSSSYLTKIRGGLWDAVNDLDLIEFKNKFVTMGDT